jgi:hypothetical protein
MYMCVCTHAHTHTHTYIYIYIKRQILHHVNSISQDNNLLMLRHANLISEHKHLQTLCPIV